MKRKLISRRAVLVGIAAPAIIRPADAFMRGGLITAASGGGGFSDSDWASSLNRPSWNAATNTLSWIGPLGGGANNGAPVLQSRVLTNSGGISTSANGQVIQGLNISGGMLWTHTGVTFKQCRISDSAGPDGTLIDIRTATGNVIEDCIIDGQQTSEQGINCTQSPFEWAATIRRNNIMGFENSITGNPFNTNILDNWIHGAGNTGNPQYDADLIEQYSCDSNLIQHNTLDSRDCLPDTFNSGTNLSNLGSVTNISIINNLYIGGPPLGWNIFVLDFNNTFTSQPLSWKFQNNGFFGTTPSFVRNGSPQGTSLGNSGNFIAATLTSQSGTLINGNGQL